MLLPLLEMLYLYLVLLQFYPTSRTQIKIPTVLHVFPNATNLQSVQFSWYCPLTACY